MESDARFSSLFGGRGSGKTVALAAKAERYIKEHPGAVGVLTAPTYRMLLEGVLPHLNGEYRRSTMEVRYPDAKIYLLSANMLDWGRGMALDFFGMEESRQGDQREMELVLRAALKPGAQHQGWTVSSAWPVLDGAVFFSGAGE